MKASVQHNKIQLFWEWFNINKAQFEDCDEQATDRMLLLKSYLNDIDDELAIGITYYPNEQGNREILISAKNDIEKFYIVQKIVNQAPLIEGWEFTALQPAYHKDMIFMFRDIKISSSTFYFLPIINEDSLDLTIYVENLCIYDIDDFIEYGHIIVSTLMGEYNYVMKVRQYDFLDLSNIEDKSQVRPLVEINDFIENFYYNKN